jgi:SAM-dependent methyltransferase
MSTGSTTPWDLDFYSLNQPARQEDYLVNDAVNACRVRDESVFRNPVQKRRHDFFAFNSIPFVMRGSSRRKFRNVLEVGCGQGAKIFGLSRIAEQYVGIDIDDDQLQDARDLVDVLGIRNATLLKENGSDLLKLWDSHGPFDLVVFYAVLEHMTLGERLEALGLIETFMQQGAVIYIGEAPNRLTPFDFHTSEIPYFDCLPSDLAVPYALKYPGRDSLPGLLRESSDPHLQLQRAGRGISYHDFFMAFEPDALTGRVARGGWSVEMLNQHPLFAFEGASLQIFRRMADWSFGRSPTPHDAFARSWIDLILVREPPQFSPDGGKVELDAFPGSTGADWFGNPVRLLQGSGESAACLTRSHVTKFIVDTKRSSGRFLVTFGSSERVVDVDYLTSSNPIRNSYRCFEVHGEGIDVRVTPIGPDSTVALTAIVRS